MRHFVFSRKKKLLFIYLLAVKIAIKFLELLFFKINPLRIHFHNTQLLKSKKLILTLSKFNSTERAVFFPFFVVCPNDHLML